MANARQQAVSADLGNFLVSAAKAECLQGMVYRSLNPAFPDDHWYQKLEKLYFHTAATNARRLKALEIIEAELATARIPVLAIKGVSMIDRVYPDIGLRFMEDMDLLVDSSRRKDFEQILSRIGYQRDGTFTHLYHQETITIDVHTHPLNIDRIASRNFLPTGYLDAIWREAAPFKPGYIYLKRPADTDSFILATHHLIKHSMSRLAWLFDLKQIARNQDQLFWKRLSKKALAHQQERVIAYGLYLLKTHLNVMPPGNGGIEKVMPPLNRLEKAVLSYWGQTQQTGETGNLLWLLCLPTVREKAAFLLESAFPRQSVLNQEQPSSSKGSGRTLYWRRSRQVMTKLWKNLMIMYKGVFRR